MQDISHVGEPDPMGPELSLERLPGLLEARSPIRCRISGCRNPVSTTTTCSGPTSRKPWTGRRTRTPGARVATVRLPSISSEPRSRTLISHASLSPSCRQRLQLTAPALFSQTEPLRA